MIASARWRCPSASSKTPSTRHSILNDAECRRRLGRSCAPDQHGKTVLRRRTSIFTAASSSRNWAQGGALHYRVGPAVGVTVVAKSGPDYVPGSGSKPHAKPAPVPRFRWRQRADDGACPLVDADGRHRRRARGPGRLHAAARRQLPPASSGVWAQSASTDEKSGGVTIMIRRRARRTGRSPWPSLTRRSGPCSSAAVAEPPRRMAERFRGARTSWPSWSA